MFSMIEYHTILVSVQIFLVACVTFWIIMVIVTKNMRLIYYQFLVYCSLPQELPLI